MELVFLAVYLLCPCPGRDSLSLHKVLRWRLGWGCLFQPFDALRLPWNLLSCGLLALPLSGAGLTFFAQGFTLALGVGVCLNRLMRLGFHGTCFLFGLLALPLSGAGLTFFAAAKKVSKESSFQPPVLTNPSLAFDWDWRWRVSVALTVEPGLARGPTVATRSTTDWCSSHTSVLALRAQTWGASGRAQGIKARGAQAQDGFWNPTCEPHVGAKRGRS